MHFSTSFTSLLSYDSHSFQSYLLNELLSQVLTIKSYNSFLFVFNFYNLNSMFLVMVVLNWKPLDSRAPHQISSLTLIPHLVSSIKTISSARSILKGTSYWIYLVISSITSAKRNRFNVDFWCRPTLIGNSFSITTC